MSHGRFRKGGSRGRGGPDDPNDPDHAHDRSQEDASPYYPPAAYTGMIARTESELLRREALLAAERAEAPARVRELLRHPPARRRILVAERPRFRTYAVAERLLDTCRRTWSDSPNHPAGGRHPAPRRPAVTRRSVAPALRAGAALEIEERGGRILLSIRRDEPDLVRDDGVLVYTGEATGDLEEALEDQRKNRSRDVAAWRPR